MMDELRWTLLGLGALFVGGLAWWELRRPRHAARSEDVSSQDASTTSGHVHATAPEPVRRVEPSLDGVDAQRAGDDDLPRIRASAPHADPPVIVVDELQHSTSREGISVVADVAVDEPRAAREPAHPAEDDTRDGAATHAQAEPWIGEAALTEAAIENAAEGADFELGEITPEDERPAPTLDAGPAVEPPCADTEDAGTPKSAPSGEAASAQPASPRAVKTQWPPEEQRHIVSLRVAPRPPNRFPGRTLRLAFQACGLEHGAMDIFHLADEQGRVIASAANLMRPGTFRLETMDSQHFHGVHLFSVLPGPLSAGRTVDELVGLARDIAQRTNGMVLDQVGQPLDEERAAQIRAEAIQAEQGG